MTLRPRIIFGVLLAHLLLGFEALNGFHFAPRLSPPADQVIDLVDMREPLSPVKQTPVPTHKVEPTTKTVSPVVAKPAQPASPPSSAVASEPSYLPQSTIAEIPLIPTKEVLARILYPGLAAKMGLEATVYLELFIDQTGTIRKVSVLKDPGNGFAESAIRALEGLRCVPAKDANGQPVSVRFRYPVRFSLR